MLATRAGARECQARGAGGGERTWKGAERARARSAAQGWRGGRAARHEHGARLIDERQRLLARGGGARVRAGGTRRQLSSSGREGVVHHCWQDHSGTYDGRGRGGLAPLVQPPPPWRVARPGCDVRHCQPRRRILSVFASERSRRIDAAHGHAQQLSSSLLMVSASPLARQRSAQRLLRSA